MSSKSEKRFLVNFQTKKATTPMRATPPATDRPTIEPVPRPESVVGGAGAADDVLEGAAELVKVTMTSEPLTVVRLGGREEASEVVVWEGGAEEVEVEVVDDFAESGGGEVEAEVEVGDEVVVVVGFESGVLVVVVVVFWPGGRISL